MNCALKDHIEHTRVKEKYRECLPCPLFELPRSKSMGAVCLHCCLRINEILEAGRQPVFIEPNTPSDLLEHKIKEHKQNLAQRLLERLLRYYEAVPKVSKKSWDEIAIHCSRCESGKGETVIATEAVNMQR